MGRKEIERENGKMGRWEVVKSREYSEEKEERVNTHTHTLTHTHTI